MRRAIFSGKLAPASRIVEMPLPDDGVRLEVVPGETTVLIAAKVTPRRFFTYDTGLTEALFVDLGPGFDTKREALVLEEFPAVGLQIAGMRILYRSRRASGRLVLRKRQAKPWFGKPRSLYDVSAQLRFAEPALDQGDFGAVEIDWQFSFPA